MVRAVRHREALGPFCMIPSRLCSGRDVHLLRGAESTTEVRHDAESPIKDLDHLRGLPVALDLPAWGRPRLRCSGCLCPLLHAKSVLPCPAGSSFNFPTDISISIFVTIPSPNPPLPACVGQAILPPHTFQEHTHTQRDARAQQGVTTHSASSARCRGKSHPWSWCIFLVFALALAKKYFRIKKLVTPQDLGTTDVSLRNV